MKYSLTLILALISSAQAATVAIVDSGVDYGHKDLKSKMWKNPQSGTQVVNGWNFVDRNNQIFDYSLLSRYNNEVFKYFEVESRYNRNALTEEDKEFIRNLTPEYMARTREYGTYAHGTHVAGIAANGSKHKIMGIKYIRTSVSSLLGRMKSAKTTDKEYYAYLYQAAEMVSGGLGEVISFLETNKADIANGSFGASFVNAQQIAGAIYKEVFKKDPDQTELFKGTFIFQSFLNTAYGKKLKKTPNTLYVFAAGNDGSNNDIYPFSPAGIDEDNSITVAATSGASGLASFSNFGAKTVDVAAPGVDILSSAPGTTRIPMSGTSQAAPFVSNLAGKLKDINPKLTPAQIKRILVETVDKKSFLAGKVKSGGIVNSARAQKAADYSRNYDLARSIVMANSEVSATKSLADLQKFNDNLNFVQMPSIFTK